MASDAMSHGRTVRSLTSGSAVTNAYGSSSANDTEILDNLYE